MTAQKEIFLAKELFISISRKITLLRVEIDLLESESNGIRTVADEIIRKLKESPCFIEQELNKYLNTTI